MSELLNKKCNRSRNNIYEYFSEYEQSEIEKVIEELDDRALAILQKRYGEDFTNPTCGALSTDEKKYLNVNLFPKIKRRLEKNRSRKISEKPNPSSETQETPSLIENNNSSKEINELNVVDESDTMEEYIKTLEIFNKDEFKELTKTKSIREIVVLSLAFGYIDDKYFFADSIANFLGMEQEEVTTIIKSGVVEYKEKLNEIIDKSLDKMVEPKSDSDSKVYVKTLKNS